MLSRISGTSAALDRFFASDLPAARQMSRPTVSASSAGPIGMPNSSIAASSVSGFMPSSSMRKAFCM